MASYSRLDEPREYVGMGSSHLGALTKAWRQLDPSLIEAARYTPICFLEAPYKPAWTFDKNQRVLNSTLALSWPSSRIGHQLGHTLLQRPRIFCGSCTRPPSRIIVPP